MIGSSTAPKTGLYVDMATLWTEIDTSNPQPLRPRPCDNDVIEFGRKYLRDSENRGDYRELMCLTLLLLGVNPTGCKSYHVRSIAGVSNARWMGKIINEMKLVLFRKEFIAKNLISTSEMNDHEELVRFLIQFYVRQWLSCPLVTEAPVNDLQLYKELSKVVLNKKSSKDYRFAKRMLDKLDGHLWYLSEELVVVCLFGKQLSNAEKAKCARAMIKASSPRGRSVTPDGKLTTPILNGSTKIWQLFGAKSWVLFNRLGKGLTDNSFLSLPVRSWDSNDDFIYIKDILMNMKVVNDAAERGILSAKQVHCKITYDSTDKQNFLLAIPHVREKLKKITKADLLNFHV